ncbi:hypothetical protein KIN20_013291 [Parelaphostrongylus tenuis]|uniref:Uncharacterized protein n=1 Tax=Parelaphostrongylus tenuis TaxID=148309 RepID=A0AAD5MBW4_PARTN|nr:hypothetical protein KIN20_013291 [Parelaphostrongylus tenuis]
MLVFYLMKAVQITMAVIGIYKLLSVEQLCEVKEVKSLSASVAATRLSIPEFHTEFETDHKKGMAEKRSRKIRSASEPLDDNIVVARDASLEETHEENLKSENMTTMGVTKHTEPQTSTEIVTIKTSDVKGSTLGEKMELEESTRKTELSTTTHSSLKSTLKELSSTADSTVSSIVEKLLSNTDGLITSIANSSEEFDSDDDNTTTTFMTEATKSPTKASAVSDKVEINTTNDRRSTRLFKSTMDKIAEDVFRKPTKGNRLVNRVYNCLMIGGRDILGISDVDLPYVAALRVPFVCLILSIVIVCLSITHAFMNFSKPRRSCILVENVAQVFLWTLSGITLVLTRLDWHLIWSGVVPGAFVPEYPASWRFVELTCCMMVILFLAEYYFHDYIFYTIYFEESCGSYKVVERRECGNSVYTSTADISENNVL